MKTLISGKIANHFEWFLNEVCEFYADFDKDMSSQATLLEVFDVISFIIADTLNVDKKHLKEEFDNSLLWIKIIACLKQHNTAFIKDSYKLWFDKKEAKYPSIDNKYHWRHNILDFTFEIKTMTYNDFINKYLNE